MSHDLLGLEEGWRRAGEAGRIKTLINRRETLRIVLNTYPHAYSASSGDVVVQPAVDGHKSLIHLIS
jgi:hypothetical protein